MRNSPLKAFTRANSQGLSPMALKAKRERDLAMAKTPARRLKKAQNQREDRRDGTVGDGLDRHHTKSGATKRITVKKNRGFYGNGTKTE